MSIAWRQALAWRMQRQLLEPVGRRPSAKSYGGSGRSRAWTRPRPSSPSECDALAPNQGSSPARLRSLRGRLVAVDVEGAELYVLSEDVDELMSTQPMDAVRLLPGHDRWVMGPATRDEHVVVPPARRTAVTGKANLVVEGGVVRGTWSAKGDELTVTWFGELPPPGQALAQEVAKLAAILDRPLRAAISTA